MQNTQRQIAVAVTTLVGLLASGGGALAESVVKVSLWDKGPTAMDTVDAHAPMGMAMQGVDMSMATMGITLDAQVIPAGDVVFQVLNDSGEFYHEMVISAVSDPASALPYLAEDRRVDEDAAGIIAEQGELKPHASGVLRTTLTPGTYILYCNISGHYAMGMWTLLSVTE